MSKHKKYNPEKRAWKGRSYKKGGTRVKRLKDKVDCPHPRDWTEAQLRSLAEGY